jgi:hypothetical protein
MNYYLLDGWSTKEFLAYWETDYYSGAVSFLLAVTGVVVSLKKRQNPKLKPLIFFFLAYVLIGIIRSINRGIELDKPLRIKITIYLDFVDTIVEFFAFYLVIKSYVVSVRIRKRLKPFPFLFLASITIYFLYYLITHGKVDQYFLQAIFTIQAFLLITGCIFYYVDIFTTEPKLKLTHDPSFWVVTGVAFFMLCTMPFSIFGMYLVKFDFRLYIQLFTLYEVFYWILFLMIIRAYFCKSAVSI